MDRDLQITGDYEPKPVFGLAIGLPSAVGGALASEPDISDLMTRGVRQILRASQAGETWSGIARNSDGGSIAFTPRIPILQTCFSIAESPSSYNQCDTFPERLNAHNSLQKNANYREAAPPACVAGFIKRLY